MQVGVNKFLAFKLYIEKYQINVHNALNIITLNLSGPIKITIDKTFHGISVMSVSTPSLLNEPIKRLLVIVQRFT